MINADEIITASGYDLDKILVLAGIDRRLLWIFCFILLILYIRLNKKIKQLSKEIGGMK